MTISKNAASWGSMKGTLSRSYRRHVNKHCLSKKVYPDKKTADMRVLGSVVSGHFKTGASYKCDYCYGWHITTQARIPSA